MRTLPIGVPFGCMPLEPSCSDNEALILALWAPGTVLTVRAAGIIVRLEPWQSKGDRIGDCATAPDAYKQESSPSGHRDYGRHYQPQ